MATDTGKKARKKGGKDKKEVEAELLVSADITEARKAIKEIESQMRSIKNISVSVNDDGLIANDKAKKIQRHTRIADNTYSESRDKLGKELDRLETIINTRNEQTTKIQSHLNRARGDNKWGDVATPNIIQHLEKRLRENLMETDGLDLNEIKKSIDALNETMGKLDDAKNKYDEGMSGLSDSYVEQKNFGSIVQNVLRTAGLSTMLSSFHSLRSNVKVGKEHLREFEYTSSQIGMKSYDFAGDDAALRKIITETGKMNQFTTRETLKSVGLLTSGGGYTEKEKLMGDTENAQRYARAFATDPAEIADAFTDLRKLGTYDEGEMYRFAEIIGATVAKSNMKGREEELLRSTANLIQQSSSGLIGISEEQVAGITGLQSILSESIPELRGERGADLLSRMDSSIKSGSQISDLVMGKGTKYRGMEGMWDLQLAKEKGISDPRNLETIIQNAIRMTSSDQAQKMVVKESLGLSATETEALYDSGIIEKVGSGDFRISREDLESLRRSGFDTIADQLANWDKTRGKKRAYIDAKDESVRLTTAKPFERLGTGLSNLKHKFVPEWLQSVGAIGAGVGGLIGGSVLSSKGIGKSITGLLSKTLFGTVGEGSKFRGLAGIKDLGSILKGSGTEFFKSAKSTVSSVGSSVAQKIGSTKPAEHLSSMFKSSKLGQTAKSAAESVTKAKGDGIFSFSGFSDKWSSMWTSGMQKVVDFGGKFDNSIGRGISSVGEGLKGASKIAPVVGTVVDIGLDRWENPEHDFGRSVTKGVSGTLGGIGGVVAAGLLGLGTGGLGLIAAAIGGIGGSLLGKKVGDEGYSLFAGDEDRQAAKNRKARDRADREKEKLLGPPTSREKFWEDAEPLYGQGSSSTVKAMMRQSMNNKSQDETRMQTKQGLLANPELYDGLEDVSGEHRIKVIIDGQIQGLTKENQDKVSDSMKEYFLSMALRGNSNPFMRPNYGTGLNLALDQIRK